ncbi:Transcription factor 25 [Nymphon striatum]|nr:Transcription factor 25 [Nymphon striatum]
MSLRTLKKLRGDSDLQLQIGLDGQSVSESEDGAERGAKPNSKRNKKKQLINNPFALLDGAGGSPSDTEAKEDDDKEGTSTSSLKKDPVEAAEIAKHMEETKHKNKKKRKSRLNKQRSSEIVLEEDEIDASIREVNKILGVDINSSTSKDDILTQDHSHSQQSKNLLTVAHKHLNPNNEMRKMFGSKVVHAEQSKRRGRHKSHSKATWLVAHRPNWPPLDKLGLSMIHDESKGSQFFRFEHSKQYQNVQFQLQAAIESFNPENIAALLRVYPYHVDSLIQLSDACKMGEDLQMAAELIEGALYSLESCFHTLFNITLGTCRLDYRRPENRSFFIALFKHINFIGMKGCYRTALEFSKLLLSLDPDDDPVCILLIIDFYAVKSGQYEFIIRLFDEWEATRNFSKLPNFAFSVALAKFHLSREKSMEYKCAEADKMLQNSLMMFPSFLLPLLDKCSVQPDSEVSNSDFFGKLAKDSESPALKLLISMYIDTCFPLWKEPEVLGWLEKNVKKTLKNLNSNENIISEYKQKRLNIYKAKLPINICRYAILREVKENLKALPTEILQNPGPGYDPVPPADSITSYTRPSREPQAGSGDQNVLSLLFRSMIPTFTAEQHQDRRQDQVLAMLNNPEEGAAGGATPGIGNDLQRSVSSLIDAVRDLLSNLHLPEIPRDGDGDDEDSDDEREE